MSVSEAPITFLEVAGLSRCPPFVRDRVFLCALAAGSAVWMIWAFITPVAPLSWSRLSSFLFLSVALWQPLVEELLFRGVIQGTLSRAGWRRELGAGMTIANVATSVLFVAGHLLTHPLLWALSVLFPSLLFGVMRDRFHSTYPAIALHVFYNTGYFLLAGT